MKLSTEQDSSTMVVYSCHCVNIKIFAQALNNQVKPEVLESSPWGTESEIVQLVDQGFQFSHKCLVHRTRSGPWTIYICVPCHMRTHAVDNEAKVIAVSPFLKKGNVAVNSMENGHNFSPAFQLCINGISDASKEDDVQPQSYETLQKQLGELQNTLTDYLKKEEDGMEQRVRKFEEEQRSKFRNVSEAANNEKAKLISLLFNNSEGHIQPDTKKDKPVEKSHTALTYSKSTGEPRPEKRFSRQISDSHVGRRRREPSPDDVFAMDELDIDLDEENDNVPRKNSGRNNSADNRLRHEQDRRNSNSPHNRSRSRGKDVPHSSERDFENSRPSILSSSVPISMPMAPRNLRDSANIDDDIEELAEFDDIPRHMQALSESIQDHERYIFGDRPRQRVNTGDFSQVNWR